MPTKNSKSPNRITIVQILADANRSGAPMHVLQLAQGLDSGQFESVIVGPDGPMRQEFEQAGFTYHVFQPHSKFDLLALARLRRILHRCLAGNRESIVHCQGVQAGLFGRLAAIGLGRPVVYTEHSWTADYHLPSQLNTIVQVMGLRLLDLLTTQTVAVSKAVADFLVQAKITDRSRVQIIYHGIDTQTDTRLRPNNRLIIGSVGSLTWQKNYAWLLEVFSLVLKELPNCQLEIVGEGSERAALERQIDELGLQDRVTLLGQLERSDLRKRTGQWSLYVQSSVNEAFGLATAEAIAAGLPALVSEVGSLSEIVGTKNGLLSLGDKEESAKKIIEILKNNKKREALWQDEHATIQQFSSQQMLLAYSRLYRDLI